MCGGDDPAGGGLRHPERGLGQLGFEEFGDSGVHALDLSLVTLDNCLREQQKRAETYRVLP